jgi:hypothetical protein
LLFGFCGAAFGQKAGGSEVVDGITAYYGIVPSEIIGTHKPDHSEATMHGGIPSNKRSHHLVIALFEQKNFDRIINAEVFATVAELGLGGETKPLQAFTINDSLSYGNYFDFTRGTLYQITVLVRMPSMTEPVTFHFEYKHT